MSLLLPRPSPSREDDRPRIKDYLVSYGSSGAFGRFEAACPLALRRGDRAVVQTPRGLELGTVLCPAGPTHARLLVAQGKLLRSATADDLKSAQRLGAVREPLFQDCTVLTRELNLPIAIVDVEMLLDGRKAIVHFLGAAEAGLTPLVDALADRHDLLVFFENASAPVGVEEEEHGGCGEPGCGRASGGSGCTSCGTGGCSSCSSGKVDMRAYFAHLRTQMENRRVPLA